MRPFLTALTLSATVAAALWWHQRTVIAGLRSDLTARSRLTAAPTEEKPAPVKRAPKKHDPKVVLRNPDGSPVITSRNAVRGALEAAKYIRSLSREALEKLLAGEDPDNTSEGIGLALAGWGRLAELDPRAALALSSTTTMGEDLGFFIVLHDWLIRDRKAALQWFHDQPDSERKGSFLTVAGLVLSSSDPGLLSQLSDSISDPALQQKSLVTSLIAQSTTDPDAAIARLSELKDSSSREEVLQSLFGLHGTTRPRQLMEQALPLALEGTEPKHMLGMMLRNDVNKDPAGALAWLTSRSTAEINALRTASSLPAGLHNFGTLDAATMQAAVAQLEKPEDRDWLMGNYYAGTARTAPLDALQAVSTKITDPALRTEGVSYVLSRSVRDGREAELEPFLTSQPEKEQAALRLQIATWKASIRSGGDHPSAIEQSPVAPATPPSAGSSGTSPPPPPHPQPPAQP